MGKKYYRVRDDNNEIIYVSCRMGVDIEVKTGKFIPHEFYDTYFSEFEDAKKKLCENCIGRIKNMEQWVR